MKSVNNIALLCCYAIAGTIGLLFLGSEALGSENAGNWRSMYDLVMRWLNFGIIVFLIVKFAREPLMNFLRGQKEALEQQIGTLEEDKDKAAGKVKETLKMLDDSTARFAKLKQRITEQGENKRQKIIEDAQNESSSMLEGAKQRIDSLIFQAKKDFRSELIDEAIVLAATRLPAEINDDDSQKLVDQYLASTSAE